MEYIHYPLQTVLRSDFITFSYKFWKTGIMIMSLSISSFEYFEWKNWFLENGPCDVWEHSQKLKIVSPWIFFFFFCSTFTIKIPQLELLLY